MRSDEIPWKNSWKLDFVRNTSVDLGGLRSSSTSSSSESDNAFPCLIIITSGVLLVEVVVVGAVVGAIAVFTAAVSAVKRGGDTSSSSIMPKSPEEEEDAAAAGPPPMLVLFVGKAGLVAVKPSGKSGTTLLRFLRSRLSLVLPLVRIAPTTPMCSSSLSLYERRRWSMVAAIDAFFPYGMSLTSSSSSLMTLVPFATDRFCCF
mmetsp:Transcript_19550/g.32667  ORF Transcript_19550/g.32667 Transcript_19550/m.32667 type:complete len:204 (-) Transcript_19550:924-1535(-)